MNRFVYFVLGVFLILGGLAVVAPPGDSAIPPTPAFQNIRTNDTDATTNPEWVNATRYNDDLWIISDGSILIEIVQYSGGSE